MEAGYIVIRFHHKADWNAIFRRHPDIFGSATRMSAAALSKPGTLVHARGREWVVLPESTDDLLMVRPLGGLDEEITGILPAVEPVESADVPAARRATTSATSPRASSCATPRACPPAPPPARSAASAASPSSRAPTSSCRC